METVIFNDTEYQWEMIGDKKCLVPVRDSFDWWGKIVDKWFGIQFEEINKRLQITSKKKPSIIYLLSMPPGRRYVLNSIDLVWGDVTEIKEFDVDRCKSWEFKQYLKTYCNIKGLV